jgi:hypothetical protein
MQFVDGICDSLIAWENLGQTTFDLAAPAIKIARIEAWSVPNTSLTLALTLVRYSDEVP